MLLYIEPVPLPELRLIERIRGQVRAGAQARQLGNVLAGIGDDCAILRGDKRFDLLITTDFSLEGVHFRREWHPARSVGHRCLARGLSDISAMGGQPTAAFLSLALPARMPQKWVDGFMAGFSQLARRSRVVLAGGDTAQSIHGVAADIIVLGRAPKGKAILRSGAKPGDAIYVTGRVGASGAVLRRLLAGRKVVPRGANRRHFYSEPRLTVGQWLCQHGVATAMIDLSDGLSTDLAHICRESGVSAVLELGSLPLVSGADGKPDRRALHWGEDYELLFTARRNIRIPARIRGVPVTKIGEIQRREKHPVVLQEEDGRARPLQPEGWQHFEMRRG